MPIQFTQSRSVAAVLLVLLANLVGQMVQTVFFCLLRLPVVVVVDMVLLQQVQMGQLAAQAVVVVAVLQLAQQAVRVTLHLQAQAKEITVVMLEHE
jgi:hypothetical protein